MRTQLISLLTVVFVLAGCASPHGQTSKLDTFDQLDRTTLSPQQQRLLADAKHDSDLVDAGKEPVNARLKHRLRDGGTRVYAGNGYLLIASGRMETRHGVFGQILGPTITLSEELTGDRSIRIENTKFVPSPDRTEQTPEPAG